LVIGNNQVNIWHTGDVVNVKPKFKTGVGKALEGLADYELSVMALTVLGKCGMYSGHT
jgi:hypothetical protein